MGRSLGGRKSLKGRRVFDLTLFFLFLPIAVVFWLFWLIFFWPRFFLGSKIFQRLIDVWQRKTITHQRKEIIKEVEKESRVLDVGAGNGYLAQALIKNKKAQLTCVDVADFNKTNLALKIFDGVNLPFEDKSFDFVILSFVVHHAHQQEKLLKECTRVCQGKILILEDEPVLGKSFFAKAHQTVYNFLYHLDDRIIYYSPSGWNKVFKKCGLEVVREESRWGVGAIMGLMKRRMFVLENSKLKAQSAKLQLKT